MTPMDRRSFLRAGTAAGLAGLGGLTTFCGAGRGPRPASGDSSAAVDLPTRGDELWLNWNESPLGASPAAREAVAAALDEAGRYPDLLRDRLIEALAARHDVARNEIVLGCGSTEILQMIVQSFAAPDALLVMAHPTFEAVGRYQRPHDYRMERVPLTPEFAHDLSRMRRLAEAHPGPTLVYLCNPNNPTGTITPSAEIDAWIEEAKDGVLFAVDEAYYEYVKAPGYWSARKWTRERENVIVTRTFSKIYGLAGLRLGYAFAHPRTAVRLRAYMASDNANNLALAAALASLADESLIERGRRANDAARKIVERALDDLDLAFLPSHTNFLMHRIRGDLETYIARMKEKGNPGRTPLPPTYGVQPPLHGNGRADGAIPYHPAGVPAEGMGVGAGPLQPRSNDRTSASLFPGLLSRWSYRRFSEFRVSVLGSDAPVAVRLLATHPQPQRRGARSVDGEELNFLELAGVAARLALKHFGHALAEVGHAIPLAGLPELRIPKAPAGLAGADSGGDDRSWIAGKCEGRAEEIPVQIGELDLGLGLGAALVLHPALVDGLEVDPVAAVGAAGALVELDLISVDRRGEVREQEQAQT